MRAYQDMVFSTAARIVGNDAHAEDIAQEVFLKAYEDFDRLKGSASAGGWLRTVATNLALNHVTRYRRRWRFFSELLQREDDEQELPFAVPENLLSGIDADRRRAIVEEALRALPDAQRVPIVLYHFEDMSYAEIAERLHISLAKVKVDIFRGRAALAGSFATRGLTDAGEPQP
jgi:RNA polymerase sigma-70 factor (ECF subfamily)